MDKPMYHIKSNNEAYFGYRNRAGMTLRFEHGEATTDNKAVAKYWHDQPGYTCAELAVRQGSPTEATDQPVPAPVDTPTTVRQGSPAEPPAAAPKKGKKPGDAGK